MQVGGALGDLALGRAGQIPTDRFTLTGLPYDPNSYNLNNILQNFSPVSFPRDMAMAGSYGGSYGAPTGGYYGGGQQGGKSGGGQYQPGGFGGATTAPYQAPPPDYSEQKFAYDMAGRDVQTAAERARMDYNRQVDAARNEWASAGNTGTVGDLFQGYYEGQGGGEYLGDGGAEVATPEYSPTYDKYRFQLKDPNAQYGNMTITGVNSSPFRRDTTTDYTLDEFLNTTWRNRDRVNDWSVSYNRDPADFDPSTANIQWDAGQAPDAFDADYYSQAMGLGEGANAWQHYVQNNIGQDNYRSGFSPTPIDQPTDGTQPAAQQQAAQQQAAQQQAATGGLPFGGTASPPPPGFATNAVAGEYGPYGAPTDGQLPMSWPTANQNYLPYDPRSYGNVEMFSNNVQDAVYDQQMRNLQPTFQRQYDKQVQDLANRGIPPGSEAWKSATEELNRNQANAYQQAANQAISAGGQEASRLMGMEQQLRGTAFNEATTLNQLGNAQNMDRVNLEQTLRNRALQERLLERTQAFNEASALLQGSPALTMPNTPAIPTYNLQAPDVIGAHNAAFQNQMSAYNAQAQASAGAWQGAGQMVSGLASIATKCARKYKEDFGPADRILDRMSRCEVQTWRYKREIEREQPMHISPFAEDVHEELGIGDGDTIPFIDLIGVCWRSIQELNEDIKQLKKENARLKK